MVIVFFCGRQQQRVLSYAFFAWYSDGMMYDRLHLSGSNTLYSKMTVVRRTLNYNKTSLSLHYFSFTVRRREIDLFKKIY
jgi:hypothetical protein